MTVKISLLSSGLFLLTGIVYMYLLIAGHIGGLSFILRGFVWTQLLGGK